MIGIANSPGAGRLGCVLSGLGDDRANNPLLQ